MTNCAALQRAIAVQLMGHSPLLCDSPLAPKDRGVDFAALGRPSGRVHYRPGSGLSGRQPGSPRDLSHDFPGDFADTAENHERGTMGVPCGDGHTVPRRHRQKIRGPRGPNEIPVSGRPGCGRSRPPLRSRPRSRDSSFPLGGTCRLPTDTVARAEPSLAGLAFIRPRS